jgi:hypothetical protein
MASFVIDASATLPWCFDDEATAYTEGLLNRCAAGEEVMVASVWPLEITCGLLFAQHRERVTAERVEQSHVQILRFLALRDNLPLATLDIELKQAARAAGVRLIE